mmetsp:Transcript_56690/g.130311  ORF Transcript_56690/g.130311 Transcript_56690/m.130311 type:complete len:234 (-) Transcript_56690:675-1376(-)
MSASRDCSWNCCNRSGLLSAESSPSLSNGTTPFSSGTWSLLAQLSGTAGVVCGPKPTGSPPNAGKESPAAIGSAINVLARRESAGINRDTEALRSLASMWVCSTSSPASASGANTEDSRRRAASRTMPRRTASFTTCRRMIGWSSGISSTISSSWSLERQNTCTKVRHTLSLISHKVKSESKISSPQTAPQCRNLNGTLLHTSPLFRMYMVQGSPNVSCCDSACRLSANETST